MKIRKSYQAFITGILVAFILSYSTVTDLLSRRSDYLGKKISDVVFKGNKNTLSDDILAKIEMRKGMILTEKLLNKDLASLFSTGYFYNIDIQGEVNDTGVKVIFELNERPRVEEIEFIGADEVFPSDLRDKMPLKENEVVSPEKINAARELILKKYRDEGFFHAYVKFEIGKLNPKTNLVKIKFIIDEGDEIPVSKINILGAKNIDPAEIQSILELKEAGFIESGNFKETSFETDKQKIVAYLKSKGYLDAELVNEGTNWEIHWENPRIKDKRVIIVNFKVSEGDLYFFNGYTTAHDLSIEPNGQPMFLNKENNPAGTPKAKFKPVFEVDYLENLYEFTNDDVGDIFDEGKFVRDRAMINELYSGKGYLFAQVAPKRRYLNLSDEDLKAYENCLSRKNPVDVKECEEDAKVLNIKKLRKLLDENPDFKGKKFVHVDFLIRENNLAYVENIIIKGNKKTLEKVIRRELLFKTGDLFNSQLVNRSRERIFNLGYFKEVNFNMRPGSDETKMNLIVELVEQPTGTISMGGGYGTISGFSIFTELGENNLNGTGQRVSGRLEFGPLRKMFQLSWTEPWIFDKPWSLTVSVFYTSQTLNVGAAAITENNNQSIKESASFERSRVGVSAGIGHRFFINWSHFHRYSPSFFISTRPTSLVSDQVLAEVSHGWQFRSQLTNGISFDDRDNIFNSTSGKSLVFSVDNVGQYLGGQSHFDQIRPMFEFFHTWFDYTLFGLIRSNALRRWRVVQEFRTSSVFTYERVPVYHEQDKQKNPYIQIMDLNYLGGYESLRGWRFDDRFYPTEWRNGSSSRILFGSELRFPIEPSLLWFVIFFDAGAMYEEVNRAIGERAKSFKEYDSLVQQQRALANPLINPTAAMNLFLYENYDSSGKKNPESPFSTEDPGRLVLSVNNVALDRFRFSWGFGLRIQIPVLPLRLYFAQKLRYTGGDGGGWNNHPFTTYEADKGFKFVFGIGDFRF